MDDVLLSYYNRELNYIRKLGAEFSEKYPKVAGRLRLDGESVEDPHVSRLIESFAFLTARIRHSLDDNFPEVTEALMGILYPDYHAPVPSMGIVQFKSLPQLTQVAKIPSGEMLRMQTHAGESCYFKTCADVDVLPILVESAKIYSLPIKAPKLPENIKRNHSIKSVMKVKILPIETEEPFDFSAESLCFYLNAQPDIAFKLREYFLNKLVGVAIAENAFDGGEMFLSANSVQSLGFQDDYAMLDYDGRASSAHRLLSEYFLFPQKFLFLSLNQIDDVWKTFPDGFECYFYFSDMSVDLSREVDENTLSLGCVPVINSFESRCEPIKASSISQEVKLEVSGQFTNIADIYKITEVTAVNGQGEKKVLLPFYGSKMEADEHETYWSIRRENSLWQKGVSSRGTDAYISFVDQSFEMTSPENDWIINVNAICNNRDLPAQLPFGPNKPDVYFMDGGAGLRIKCLLPPTATLQPKLESASRWQLISQLSLQHLSEKDGLQRLKQLLQLYNFSDSKDVSSLIESIQDLSVELTTARVINQGRSALCQGTKFIVTCDESLFEGNSLFIFGEVLNEFLSQFCSINSFTQLDIKTTKNYKIEYSWEPRVGCQPLI